MDTGIGGILREARSRRKLDLSEVEGAIRIRMRYLLAMENEEWEVLPGGAYTRGFIRTYASYLGLDGDRLAEDYRKATGGEGAPRGEPVIPTGGDRGRSRAPRRAAAVFLVGGLLAAMVVIGILGGGHSEPAGPTQPRAGQATPRSASQGGNAARSRGAVLRLSAAAEVWVCLLDGGGNRLINGQILEAGAQAGPFRSNRFTLSLGNGSVSLTLDNRTVSLPESASPAGYRIASDGSLSPLSEAERPTCT